MTTVDITATAFGGWGIARNNGKVIFVYSALPGDKLEVEITEEKKNHSFAKIVQVISPSEQRIQPECQVFTECGGCSYQNTSYENELQIKKDILIDQLNRIGGIEKENIPPVNVINAERFRYRSHATVKSQNGKKGFFTRGTNDFTELPVTGCLLLGDELNSEIMKHEPDSNEFRAAIDCNNKIFFSDSEPKSVIEDKADGILYRRNINDFFQANSLLREEMLRTVLDMASPSKDQTVLDIGCGTGFFSLYLSDHVKKCIGFDISRSSIQKAKLNAKLNEKPNTEFIVKNASEINPHSYAADTVILDPPRAGLSKKARRTVNTIRPKTIVYVSCNPSTYSRDIKDFIKEGYSLERISLIDMFPCTHHIEIISRLVITSAA